MNVHMPCNWKNDQDYFFWAIIKEAWRRLKFALRLKMSLSAFHHADAIRVACCFIQDILLFLYARYLLASIVFMLTRNYFMQAFFGFWWSSVDMIRSRVKRIYHTYALVIIGLLNWYLVQQNIPHQLIFGQLVVSSLSFFWVRFVTSMEIINENCRIYSQ